MGDPLVDPAGVPALGVVVRSNTGPSYMPRGTACISAICHQREEDSDASLLPGSILPWQCQAAAILGSPVPPQRQFTLPPLCPSVLHAQDLPAALRPGTAPPTHLLCDGLPSLLPCKVCRAWCKRQSLSMGLCCVDGGEGHFAQSPRF